MSRAKWKLIPVYDHDVYNYTSYTMFGYARYNVYLFKRYVTLHPLNLHYKYYIHQGKTHIRRVFTRYHWGFKLAEFTKTKRPHFFRSKRKK